MIRWSKPRGGKKKEKKKEKERERERKEKKKENIVRRWLTSS
jgi:hypothetical protein